MILERFWGDFGGAEADFVVIQADFGGFWGCRS